MGGGREWIYLPGGAAGGVVSEEFGASHHRSVGAMAWRSRSGRIGVGKAISRLGGGLPWNSRDGDESPDGRWLVGLVYSAQGWRLLGGRRL